MKRLLKILFITTLALPLITGAIAVLAKFGDPWGMGADNPWGVFITAALPLLPPGLYQVFIWPLTYGVAIVLTPLALLQRRLFYLIPVLFYLIAISTFWTFNWLFAPEYLNAMFDGATYQPGYLNRGLRKIGVLLLTDSTLLVASILWWFWQECRTLGPSHHAESNCHY